MVLHLSYGLTRQLELILPCLANDGLAYSTVIMFLNIFIAVVVRLFFFFQILHYYYCLFIIIFVA